MSAITIMDIGFMRKLARENHKIEVLLDKGNYHTTPTPAELEAASSKIAVYNSEMVVYAVDLDTVNNFINDHYVGKCAFSSGTAAVVTLGTNKISGLKLRLTLEE